MPRDLRAPLHDVLQAIRAIREFTKDMTLDDYLNDLMVRSAVERQFEIIGEALNHAGKIETGLEELIPDLPRIISFRNRLIHGYSTISDETVWGIKISKLDSLENDVRKLLDSLNQSI